MFLQRNGYPIFLHASKSLTIDNLIKRLNVQVQLFRRWLIFYRQAVTIYDIHSPFVFQLVRAMLEDRRRFYVFSDLAGLRDRIKHNYNRVPQSQFGAGSQIITKNEISIAELGRKVAVDEKNGKLLFRLVNFLKPKQLLELGTSLGLSTLYQAAAALSGQMITIEGSPAIAQLAQQHIDYLRFRNISLLNGSFESQLPLALSSLSMLDYVYLDGDHSYAPTLSYFEQCLPHLHDQSAFVVADIYWSDDMLKAWKELQVHPSVSLSVDFYDFGILFFRKENQEKEHFSVVPRWWKPWRLGFW